MAAPPSANAQDSSLFGVTSRTAIQGVCAWPNLQRVSDGSLVALIFNQPCHGLWEGDLDCWASEDEGKTWHFRGRPAEHEPTTNRMNRSAGIANNGDIVVLWSSASSARAPCLTRMVRSQMFGIVSTERLSSNRLCGWLEATGSG